MDLKELAKMTIVKLREEAHKFEDVKGTLGMSKEQLIDLLCERHGIAKKQALPKGIGRRALKGKIMKLRGDRDTVLAGGDRKQIQKYRHRLKSLRRRLRKVIRLAEHGKVKTSGKEAAAPQ
ncbi:MAG TPA: hypothetical protein VFG76_05150 [Candidatus Polarisedimenticolia bacterium]|nr:hypothetical protein [Candidatus Polarisedimenticolia bacterium]